MSGSSLKSRILVAALLVCIVVVVASTVSWSNSDTLTQVAQLFPATARSYAQVSKLLSELDKASPLVTVRSIGQSHEGRDIWLATATDRDCSPDEKVRLFVIARQHGDEPAGTTAVLGLLEYLGAATGAIQQELLRRFEINVIPVANPDGAVASRRTNANHVDLNRDWGSFTQPETKAISVAIRSRHPHTIIDLHELPTKTTKRSYQENFIETVGAHSSLPATLSDNSMAASQNISFWMNKYNYPLNVYYDYPGDSLRLCHHYWGLGEGYLSFLCESKPGSGRSLAQRAGFHVLSILGIINYLGQQQLKSTETAKPHVPVANPPQPPLQPLVVSLHLEPNVGGQGEQIAVHTQVEGTENFGFVTIKVAGAIKYLTNQRNDRYVLDVSNLAAGQHIITAEVCDNFGTVCASQQTTCQVPVAGVQVAQ